MTHEPGDTYESECGLGLAAYLPSKDPLWPWHWYINGVDKAHFATLDLTQKAAAEHGMTLHLFSLG